MLKNKVHVQVLVPIKLFRQILKRQSVIEQEEIFALDFLTKLLLQTFKQIIFLQTFANIRQIIQSHKLAIRCVEVQSMFPSRRVRRALKILAFGHDDA